MFVDCIILQVEGMDVGVNKWYKSVVIREGPGFKSFSRHISLNIIPTIILNNIVNSIITCFDRMIKMFCCRVQIDDSNSPFYN